MKQGKITNSIVLNDIGLEIIQTPRSSVKKILDEENLNYREIEEQKRLSSMVKQQNLNETNPFEVVQGAGSSGSGSNRASGASKKFHIEQIVVPPMFFDTEY